MRTLLTGLVLVLLSGCAATPQPPKNIIMVIGDGMGPAYTTGYRLFADDPATTEVEATIFDQMLVGMATTYPAPVSGYVTDSAASATALATGSKSYNGAIGVDVNKQPLTSVLQQAKLAGKKTGIAVTSQINHATPAGYMAHNESRHNYDAIADSYFDERVAGQFKADVMLGGGWTYFLRDDRNLVAEFTGAGFQYVDTFDELAEAPVGEPLLGLFADKGLPWALDYPEQQRLPLLAKTAVKHLENPKGYFLLIEASQVDWAGHANDVADAMGEMHDMAMTLEWLYDYVASRDDTLMVVTADHSTGGLTIGANGDYAWRPQVLHRLPSSVSQYARQLLTLEPSARSLAVTEQLDIEIQAPQAQALEQAADVWQMADALEQILDLASNTGWTTGGHTGVDVEIFAVGKGAEQFRGLLNNTDIAKKLKTMVADSP